MTNSRFADFVNIISLLYRSIQKVKAEKMREFGLSGSHVMCLFYLSQYPEGLTGSKLCQLIAVDKAAISRVLAELKKQGYIHYPQNTEGRPGSLAMLTEKGVAIGQSLDGLIHDIVKRSSDGVTGRDREAMYRALDIISKNLLELIKEGQL